MASASSGGADKKTDKTPWAATLDSINPWGGSRSSTPVQSDFPADAAKAAGAGADIGGVGDHSSSPFYGISTRNYPSDCPLLKVKWFHAVDVPKSKPKFLKQTKKISEGKLEAAPKKYVAFSDEDSQAIERTYQDVLEDINGEKGSAVSRKPLSSKSRFRGSSMSQHPNSSLSGSEEQRGRQDVRVAVNEDFLFDVDLNKRELAPAYWLGPTYDVRRGSWFYQDGSTMRPCEENLSAQLEEGYLKYRPWTIPTARARADSVAKLQNATEAAHEAVKAQDDAIAALRAAVATPQPHRLFGSWMNSSVTYQDATTAFLSSDSMLSWVTSTMYERFAGGAYLSGIKVVRGFVEPGKAKADEKRSSTLSDGKASATASDTDENARKRKSTASAGDAADEVAKEVKVEVQSRGNILKRQLSSLLDSGSKGSDAEAEALRQREEEAIRDDYNAPEGESQGREIEHLVLVTHGIGQLLSMKMESINFVHDVSSMRKTLKAVYTNSQDLRALNSDTSEGPGNSKIQVLPVCWRHMLDFPKKRQEKRGEQDIGLTVDDEEDYPSLEDITVEGVAFARNLISDLALDILLYQSAYREQICDIVVKESNRIYNLFVERNPGFKGKVHVMGHSLGSAIMFDILCRQKEVRPAETARNPLRFWPAEPAKEEAKKSDQLVLDFEADDFYCLGSPIGLFQMLKGRTISARHLTNNKPAATPFDPDEEDPFTTQHPTGTYRISPITNLPFSVSSPKISQLYNIFHPSDPIAYRVEPLISSAMSTLKPQVLPYTKSGFLDNVVGAANPQNLVTGLGVKVGQSVSGFWSSLSAGIASNILNRSLGLSQEDVAKITNSASTAAAQEVESVTREHLASPGAGTNVSAGVLHETLSSKTAERQKQLAESSVATSQSSSTLARPGLGARDPTLIDDDLETLFSRFQKKRSGLDNGDKLSAADAEAQRQKWKEEEAKAARLRKEEAKVKALNRNGRVDYSIQESVLDFNPVTTIASHMSYWADEDVNHFIISQLLANKGVSRQNSWSS